MLISDDLERNQTMLLLIPSQDYNCAFVDIVRELALKGSVCYVTLNKPYDSLRKIFERDGVQLGNIMFIDAISKTFQQTPDHTDSCYFVSSPAALTELSLVISIFLRHRFDYLIFDSLTNLLMYEHRIPVAKFVSVLVNKIESSETRAVFYAMDVRDHPGFKDQLELIEESEMFVDKVLTLEECRKSR